MVRTLEVIRVEVMLLLCTDNRASRRSKVFCSVLGRYRIWFSASRHLRTVTTVQTNCCVCMKNCWKAVWLWRKNIGRHRCGIQIEGLWENRQGINETTRVRIRAGHEKEGVTKILTNYVMRTFVFFTLVITFSRFSVLYIPCVIHIISYIHWQQDINHT